MSLGDNGVRWRAGNRVCLPNPAGARGSVHAPTSYCGLHFTGNLHKATWAASLAGQGFGYLLIFAGIGFFFLGGIAGGIWFAFIGWFLLSAAQSGYQQTVVRELLSGMPVRRLPLAEVTGVSPEMSLQTLVDEYLLRRPENTFPVLSEDRLVGVVGISELQQVPREQWPETSVNQVMRAMKEEEKISSDADAWDAVRQLRQADCECQFVLEGESLQGVLTRASLVNWMQAKRELGLGL